MTNNTIKTTETESVESAIEDSSSEEEEEESVMSEEEEDGEEEASEDEESIESDEEVQAEDNANESENTDAEEGSVEEQEAAAIAEATKAAYNNYKPSQSLLKNSSPYPLIRAVDGLSLKEYNSEPSVFAAKNVSVPLRAKFSVPIHVTSSGSVVDYTVESEKYDIGFGIVAEREEGITVVKENLRADAHLEPISGRFLVGSVPCALIFTFDNEYSWFREKKVTYKVKITPPTVESISEGRKARAKSALSAVANDKMSAESRLERVHTEHVALVQVIESLEKELEEKKKSLGVIEKEEGWLKERVDLRTVQEDLLNKRLNDGWEDEVASATGDDEDAQRAEI